MLTSLMLRMNPEMEIGTDKKALQINLNANKYGTFAEIGAGQEVARRFFHVGAAAATIAKTMLAYDMTLQRRNLRSHGSLRQPHPPPNNAQP